LAALLVNVRDVIFNNLVSFFLLDADALTMKPLPALIPTLITALAGSQQNTKNALARILYGCLIFTNRAFLLGHKLFHTEDDGSLLFRSSEAGKCG